MLSDFNSTELPGHGPPFTDTDLVKLLVCWGDIQTNMIKVEMEGERGERVRGGELAKGREQRGLREGSRMKRRLLRKSMPKRLRHKEDG